jgi:hypothetical protein
MRMLKGVVTLTATARASGHRISWFMQQQSRPAIYNTFYTQRHLISRHSLRQFRAEAMEQWHAVVAA